MNWISVKDRLPDYNQRVLLYLPVLYYTDREIKKAGVYLCKEFTCTGYRLLTDFNGDLWKLSSWNQNEEREREEYRVTHWMPLPDLPKDE